MFGLLSGWAAGGQPSDIQEEEQSEQDSASRAPQQFQQALQEGGAGPFLQPTLPNGGGTNQEGGRSEQLVDVTLNLGTGHGAGGQSEFYTDENDPRVAPTPCFFTS